MKARLRQAPGLAAAPPDPAACRLGRAAVVALYEELALAPKPGLVSFEDRGSHRDMDASTFLRSLFALRHSYPRFAMLGAQGVDFTTLAGEGVAAEARMLAATGGINTHRGAIFTLGLLCASAGALQAAGQPLQAGALRRTLVARWGPALAARDGAGPHGQAPGHADPSALATPLDSSTAATAAPAPASASASACASTLACHPASSSASAGRPSSHGAQAARAHGLRGANAEAAAGMPVLFETAWPALQQALAAGQPPAAARLQAFFATLAVLDDTNLAHRGGMAGLRWAQGQAREWLDAGGIHAPDAQATARRVHCAFVQRRLSPGGAADVLAAACWLQRVCGTA